MCLCDTYKNKTKIHLFIIVHGSYVFSLALTNSFTLTLKTSLFFWWEK